MNEKRRVLAINGSYRNGGMTDQLVESVIEHLRERGAESVEEDGGEAETVVFALPKNLLNAINAGDGPKATGQG